LDAYLLRHPSYKALLRDLFSRLAGALQRPLDVHFHLIDADRSLRHLFDEARRVTRKCQENAE
jgi:hypothetical protein